MASPLAPNEQVIADVNKTPQVNIQQDAAYIDRLIDAADARIVNQYGAHPTQAADPQGRARRYWGLVAVVAAMIGNDEEQARKALNGISWENAF